MGRRRLHCFILIREPLGSIAYFIFYLLILFNFFYLIMESSEENVMKLIVKQNLFSRILYCYGYIKLKYNQTIYIKASKYHFWKESNLTVYLF